MGGTENEVAHSYAQIPSNKGRSTSTRIDEKIAFMYLNIQICDRLSKKLHFIHSSLYFLYIIISI